jgi:peroxiredoxin
MRLTIILITALCLAACTNPTPVKETKQDHYTLKGNLKGGNGKYVFLFEGFDQLSKADSALIKNDTFSFTGSVSGPKMMMLQVDHKGRPLEFILENAHMQITGVPDTIYKATVTGGKQQDDLNAFKTEEKPYDDQNAALSAIYTEAKKDTAGNSKLIDSIIHEFDALSSKDSIMMERFVAGHSNSHASAYLIARNFLYSMDLNNLQRVYTSLDTAVQHGIIGTKINEHIAAQLKVAIGQPAPDFTMNDANGKPISLSSYKGKITLVDFWASWCGPCRRENPAIVKAYNMYHPKGFEIFAVSLDKDKDKWLEAVKKDNLTWTHVSQLTGWECTILKDYAIKFIPQNVLLDKNGIIIAKNLNGAQLESELSKVQF